MRYATPAAFKDALEHRLRAASPGSVDRARQLVVFSRFLARLVPVMGSSAILKGGLALELRLERARTTKDIDLALHATPGSRERVLERLQEAARLDLGDFLVFEVEPDPEHPEIENDALKYDGYRFRVSCRLAGRGYGRPFFEIDIVLGEPLLGEPDELVMEDWLGFDKGRLGELERPGLSCGQRLRRAPVAAGDRRSGTLAPAGSHRTSHGDKGQQPRCGSPEAVRTRWMPERGISA